MLAKTKAMNAISDFEDERVLESDFELIDQEDVENVEEIITTIVIDSPQHPLDSLSFTKTVFESSEILELQRILTDYNKLLENINRLTQDDLLRLRSFILNEYRNLEFYLSDFAIRDLCLDSELPVGHITHTMFVNKMLQLENQARQTAGIASVDFSSGHLIQLRLLEFTYPIKVIAVRRFLQDIVRSVEVVVGLGCIYHFPLSWHIVD